MGTPALRMAVVVALGACHAGATEAQPGSPAVSAPIAGDGGGGDGDSDGKEGGPPDAARAPACGDESTRQLVIAGVHLTAPPGCCLRRLGEGDDISGDIVDADGRARLHYVALAHNARVGDACAALHGMRLVGTGRLGASSYRSCATAADAGPRRLCVSVGDATGTIVNVCANDPEDGYTPMDVVRPKSAP